MESLPKFLNEQQKGKAYEKYKEKTEFIIGYGTYGIYSIHSANEDPSSNKA